MKRRMLVIVPVLGLITLVFLSFKANKDGVDRAPVSESELPKYKKYATVDLKASLESLNGWEFQALPLLIEAAQIADEIFWLQSYHGDKDSLLNGAKDKEERRYMEVNYGPWDRLNGNVPFVKGVGAKPKGANFYPADITKEEFEALPLSDKKGLYNVLRRDEAGTIYTVPYHIEYKEKLTKMSELLSKAGQMCPEPELREYLLLRSEAVLTDIYEPSDVSWINMKDNLLDVIIGPIETYEDQLFGYKAAYEAYILIKDPVWSEKLARITSFLPKLQEELPVEEAYKKEKPGSNSQLAVYDVIYYAGDCNSGSKTIAVNLPNDENLQLKFGTRRSQLKNVMKAKFDKILKPISKVLIDPSQQKHIKFASFFTNTMFHEVAHGLGIKKTITGKGTVREALKEHASAFEEGKADVLGLYMSTALMNKDVANAKNFDLMDSYVTFMASIFRSVRFGATSAHGKANMMRFNYFKEMGAFTRNPTTGTYRVNKEAMTKAVTEVSKLILMVQGDGDYERAKKIIAEKGVIKDELQRDLNRLETAGIPVDIVFNQGMSVLGE